MQELLKAKIQQVVNKIVRSDSNIEVELMEIYKDMLVTSVCDIFSALSDMYEDENVMAKRIEEFIEENYKNKDEKSKTGFQTDGYMVASVPVLVPIELIAIMDGMDDITLPLVISQLSGWLLKTAMELREYEKLGDRMLEERSSQLAKHLKDKGWVA